MDNKKKHIHQGINFLFITAVLLITCTNAFSQSESIADPNIQKTITVRHIDPNIAAKVVEQIIKLKIFQLPKETLIVPNQQGKMLTAMTETAGQMKLIEEIVENIDFQITNEGTIDRIHIPVSNLIFDEFYRIISPLLSREGRLSYNITAHTLVVSEITENLKNIENFATKLDSYDFVDPNSIPDTALINTPEQTDANSTEAKAADSNEPMVAVQFSGFKIEQITERLKQWTGKEVVPSQEAMNLRVTVYSPEKMKRSEAIKLLYSAMMLQGFTTEENGNTIYIKPTHSTDDHIDIVAAEDSLENIQNKDMEIRKIFKLKYSSPSIMGQLLLPYLSSSGHFSADESTKSLLVGDTVKNLIRIEQMIGIFDSDPNALPKGGIIDPVDPNEKAQEYHMIPIKNVDVNEIANALHSILKEIQSDFTNKLTIVPLPELKSLLLFGEKEYCEITRKLLFIQEPTQNKLQRKTFRLMYAKPEDVKNKLEELFGVSISYEQSNKTTSANPLIAVTFPPLKQIVVLAPEDKMKEIEKIIMEWDSPIAF